MWSATAIRPPSGSVTRVREDGTQITCVAAQTPPSYPMRSTGRNLRSWPHPSVCMALTSASDRGLPCTSVAGTASTVMASAMTSIHRGPRHLITRQGACSLMPINELAAPWRKRERAPRSEEAGGLRGRLSAGTKPMDFPWRESSVILAADPNRQQQQGCVYGQHKQEQCYRPSSFVAKFRIVPVTFAHRSLLWWRWLVS